MKAIYLEIMLWDQDSIMKIYLLLDKGKLDD